jgi:CheY-like chemotaxis protein/HPt (histidine-containing phosphotransfer) domain-containing protein
LGYEVRTVCNGLEALGALADHDYGLVLMDCQMPVMDGYAATEAIRRTEAETGRRVPIVAVTANALQGDREHCLSVGMDGYIQKPVDLGTMQHILAQWLAASSQSAGSPAVEAAERARQDARDERAPALAASAVAGASESRSSATVELVGRRDGLYASHEADASTRIEELPILDPEQLHALTALQEPGAPDVLDKLVQEFRVDARQLLDQMRTAVQTQDARALRLAAHTLKSSAAYLGGKRLSRCCADLEALCRTEWDADLDGTAPALYEQAELAFAGLMRAIEALSHE